MEQKCFGSDDEIIVDETAESVYIVFSNGLIFIGIW